jgi:GT2 family glycosyltransferase
MQVSIIIVSYNTNLLLKNCIDSILKHTYNIEYEIIVIDNASSDFTEQIITNLYPLVKFISLTKNYGFSKANNEGIKISKGEYVFFLNSDTILLNNAIDIYYSFYIENELKLKIGTIGSVLKDFNLQLTNSYGYFPSIKSELYYIYSKFFNINIFNSITTPLHVNYVIGASLFVKKSLLNKFDNFDENYFLYYEETDMQKILNINGYNNFLIPGPEILHLEGGSDPSKFKFSFFRFYHSYKSLFYYINKNHTGFYKYILIIFYKILRCFVFFDKRISLKEKLLIFNHMLFNE